MTNPPLARYLSRAIPLLAATPESSPEFDAAQQLVADVMEALDADEPEDLVRMLEGM